MSMSTDRKRTVEARLDKLEARVMEARRGERDPRLHDTMRGMIDLLRDVLLEDEE